MKTHKIVGTLTLNIPAAMVCPTDQVLVVNGKVQFGVALVEGEYPKTWKAPEFKKNDVLDLVEYGRGKVVSVEKRGELQVILLEGIWYLEKDLILRCGKIEGGVTKSERIIKNPQRQIKMQQERCKLHPTPRNSARLERYTKELFE